MSIFLQSVNKAVQWYELKQKADNGVDADEADDCIYVKSDYKLLLNCFRPDIVYRRVEGLY